MNFSINPISRHFGLDRGVPIDRYYIENFLKKNRSYIHGHVLEVGDNYYTRRFGGKKVVKSEVLNIIDSESTTIVGNLETGENMPESSFDCIILTQVMQVIFNVKSTLENVQKALKPGGTVLLTASGISQIWRDELNSYYEYWRFTDKSLNRLLNEYFSRENVFVEAFGNVAVAKAFLDGMALHEVPKSILDYNDQDYQLLITARASKIDGELT